ncbi:BatD family protein [Amniculibacterium sp. G2-70]|uniref:BatD family protein n=1 Tax=Amniculibacterium sp. G2-70 TaxID=2767188 RepID=UPI0016541DE2|nr:BatD family protein [Amniculibacterium sp. G2-70]
MKLKFLQILLILFAIKSYGQVNIVGMTDEKEFRQNKKFVLTFIIQINGDDYIQESPIKLPDFSKFEELGSASEQNTIVDQRTGYRVNQIVYQYVLQPKQSGKLKIGSALVQVNGKMYKSESFDIFVKEEVRKSETNSVANNQNDVYLNLEIKDKEVYQYQPTVAVLRIYSKDYDQFRKVNNIHFSKQSDVEIEPINLTPQEIEPSESHANWLTQIVAIYSITPNESGKVELPSAIAHIKSNGNLTKIVGNKVNLNVKSLPENSTKNFKNAVGNYELTLQNTSKQNFYEIGKPIDITLKLSGIGNLNTVELPRLYPSKDYTFYKPKVSKNIQPKGQNFQGEIVVNYVVVPNRAGEITIKADHFSFFNDQKNEYIDKGETVLPLNILSAEQFAKTQTTIEKVNNYTNTVLEKVETPILKTSEFKVKEKSKIDWKIVLGNLVLVFGVIYGSLLYSRYRKSKKKRALHISRHHKSMGSVAETEAEIRKNKGIDFESNFNYFSILANEEKSDLFFKSFDDFHAELENAIQAGHQLSVEKWLEQKGQHDVLQELTQLKHQIEIEKFNPFKSKETLMELSVKITSVYQKIKQLN